jgi:hypothetical protein
MRHYHVLCGLRGCYMPNANDVHRTRTAAERGARAWAESYRDDGLKVTGSAAEGYYTVGDHECIEITECDYQSCMEDCDE